MTTEQGLELCVHKPRNKGATRSWKRPAKTLPHSLQGESGTATAWYRTSGL